MMIFGIGGLMMLALVTLPILIIVIAMSAATSFSQFNSRRITSLQNQVLFPQKYFKTDLIASTRTQTCTHCGAGIKPEWSYCPQCGAPVG